MSEPENVCTEPGCERPVYVITRRLCKPCYSKAWNKGELGISRTPGRKPTARRSTGPTKADHRGNFRTPAEARARARELNAQAEAEGRPERYYREGRHVHRYVPVGLM